MQDSITTFQRRSRKTEATRKLEHLADEAPMTLMKFSSVFPFDILPTSVVLEKTKVTVTKPFFIGSNDIRNILINEISHVEVTTSLWFATMRIISTIPNSQPIVINHLWKEDALQAQRIISGLMIGLREEVDLSEVPAADLKRNAERLGHTPAAM